MLLAQILVQMQEITRRLPPAPEEEDNAPQPRKKRPPPGKGYPRL